MSIVCRSCGSRDLRLSQLRTKDLSHLILLLYPVRCRVCRDRDYYFIFQAMKLPRSTQG
jgi:hypothetical protein